ncbi:MAG: diaminopimelate decarboxylase, partial [Pseudomonadota bacterium]
VGKTRSEMDRALDVGIHQFNIESQPELELLSAAAVAKAKVAPISIRVNPDVDAKTHEKISTGKAENKFGVAWDVAPALYNRAASLDGIEVVGVDVHIGSQLTDLGPFENAFRRVAGLVRTLRAAGHKISRLDLGGGLGIPYGDAPTDPPHPDAYGKMIAKFANELDCDIILEPGRLIAGNAGILVSEVIFVKDAPTRRFLILDAAMNDLMRPAMYDAYHDIIPLNEPGPDMQTSPVDIVGPVCESTDKFALARQMPPLQAGDLVAFLSAGAYSAVMSSTYNTRPLVAEVLVKGAQTAVIRPRQTVDDLIALDKPAPWLAR